MVYKPLLRHMAVLMVSFCLSSIANADTLILQSGQEIKGQIIEQTELRVMVSVQGVPRTFFLGELASINGKPIETSQVKAAKLALAQIKKPVVAPLNDEERSLIKLMIKRKPNVPPQDRPVDKKNPVPLTPPNVVPTSDGGIIVVSPGKIVKYDKDLKVIREIDLKTNNASG